MPPTTCSAEFSASNISTPTATKYLTTGTYSLLLLLPPVALDTIDTTMTERQYIYEDSGNFVQKVNISMMQHVSAVHEFPSSQARQFLSCQVTETAATLVCFPPLPCDHRRLRPPWPPPELEMVDCHIEENDRGWTHRPETGGSIRLHPLGKLVSSPSPIADTETSSPCVHLFLDDVLWKLPRWWSDIQCIRSSNAILDISSWLWITGKHAEVQFQFSYPLSPVNCHFEKRHFLLSGRAQMNVVSICGTSLNLVVYCGYPALNIAHTRYWMLIIVGHLLQYGLEKADALLLLIYWLHESYLQLLLRLLWAVPGYIYCSYSVFLVSLNGRAEVHHILQGNPRYYELMQWSFNHSQLQSEFRFYTAGHIFFFCGALMQWKIPWKMGVFCIDVRCLSASHLDFLLARRTAHIAWNGCSLHRSLGSTNWALEEAQGQVVLRMPWQPFSYHWEAAYPLKPCSIIQDVFGKLPLGQPHLDLHGYDVLLHWTSFSGQNQLHVLVALEAFCCELFSIRNIWDCLQYEYLQQWRPPDAVISLAWMGSAINVLWAPNLESRNQLEYVYSFLGTYDQEALHYYISALGVQLQWGCSETACLPFHGSYLHRMGKHLPSTLLLWFCCQSSQMDCDSARVVTKGRVVHSLAYMFSTSTILHSGELYWLLGLYSRCNQCVTQDATYFGSQHFEWQIAWLLNLRTMKLTSWTSCAMLDGMPQFIIVIIVPCFAEQFWTAGLGKRLAQGGAKKKNYGKNVSGQAYYPLRSINNPFECSVDHYIHRQLFFQATTWRYNIVLDSSLKTNNFTILVLLLLPWDPGGCASSLGDMQDTPLAVHCFRYEVRAANRQAGIQAKHLCLPWDPADSSRHRLEGKPDFKEEGMSATVPLHGWAGQWAGNWGPRPAHRYEKQLLQIQEEVDTEKGAWNGTDGLGRKARIG